MMENVLLVVCIILLLIYAFLMIDTFILVKKSAGKRMANIKDILMKRINLSIILTVIIGILVILKIVIFK